MPKPRTAKIDEIDRLVELADRIFRKPGQTSMGTAYARLFAKENAGHLLVMEDEGVLATLVGLLQADISVEGCSIRTVSMGAVCTDPAYRGKQYADTLFKMSVEKCVEDEAHLMLISGARNLYLRNDCVEVGAVKLFTFQARSGVHDDEVSSHLTIRPFDESIDLLSMITLMEQDTAYYKRTEAELAQLIRSAAVLSNASAEQHVWMACDSDGTAAGYIVFGPIEKNGVSSVKVIEYAGSDESVLVLLQQIALNFHGRQVNVHVMGDRPALVEKLVVSGASFIETNIPGTIRIIDFLGLWRSLKPYMAARVSEETLSELEISEASFGYRIAYRGHAHLVDRRGAARLVFNGPQLTETSELKEILGKLFPLPWVYTDNLNFV
ncbi:GNAT family N-acetyltransferase [Paenibacillus aceris]|uniref:GNAT family N-acyltransferase n=1 Tax=Paenibacillus aceris TaxID=869555 RepID=A0ABS4I0E9_9BACL|nr:GNAT family N-acetyltransferase [Paenibacillus aceris]MBP1964393.1 putative GNAT family N-acyltransferase [Paenibacillus aceris]NHW35891.1 GNAT family N-acetyltransferase [Paenibacillus aceris]